MKGNNRSIDNKEIAIVIPQYKSDLNGYEMIALQQASKVFSNYAIIAVIPEDLVLPYDCYFTQIERFENFYFDSVSSYNRLMLTPFFYQRFKQYEYILIYQLDAFVFMDKLPYFCGLGYDYVGAPWLYGIFNYVDKDHCIWYVGNGGLSLRRVEKFIKVLQEEKPLQDEQIKNEDLFFSSIVKKYFKVAPLEIALQFAFERQVEKCYELNKCELPMGCHAWERYNFAFWKTFIEKNGYHLKMNDGVQGTEDNLRKSQYNYLEKFSTLMKNGYTQRKLKRLINELAFNKCKKVLIFGAGFYGKSFLKLFEDLEIEVKGFCDNDRRLVGKSFCNYPIFEVNRMEQYKDKVFVVISNMEYETTMEMQLMEMGFEKRIDYITVKDLILLLTGMV